MQCTFDIVQCAVQRLLRQGIHQIQIDLSRAARILRFPDGALGLLCREWMRPDRCNFASSKLCTPKLMRLTPARR